MCGIAGVIFKKGAGEPLRADPIAMGSCLAHRGSDDSGVWIDGRVGLAHQRLSIIDISSAGSQPMVLEDKKAAITYNGEIYNFQQLKAKYLGEEEMASHSDTEVLLKLLQQEGMGILSELQGMFAFAFWNVASEEFFLARDAFGKKPLYYAETDTALIFGSEVKSLLAHPLVKAELAGDDVARYFLHEYVPSPDTGWQGIAQIPMGSYLKLAKDTLEIKTWWQADFQPKNKDADLQILRRFDELLGQAVERRMVADVPVGVFLSGGIDSSTIAWYMTQCQPQELHSCSIGFSDPSFDESSYARMAAEAMGTIHHEDSFGYKDVVKMTEELSEVMDIPLGDASLLPAYQVSKLARQRMKVVLSGDGADELLGGYGTFQADAAARYGEFLSPGIWLAVEKLLALWPVSHQYFSFDFKMKSFVRGMPYEAARRHQVWLGSFNERELVNLLQPSWQKKVEGGFAKVDEAALAAAGLEAADEISSLTIATYLLDDILVKLDRASMAVGLEARAPFLDRDLAEFLLRLPVRYKRKKVILKRLMKGRIPQKILERPKKGFGVPLSAWLAGPLFEWAQEILDVKKLGEQGILEGKYVNKVLEEHRLKKVDHRKKLWTLIAWQLWVDKWVFAKKL